ncbi:hypothetical protein G5B37_00505 [Rasiella rasia]|uniref:DUF6265 domain-containing protein n=1 Tax=Rasiella rasia TaxID=2744027 RepID=A0A6G6GHS4_9FLAO|nr:DUF6265 family protein [Rasiella rasia]QIE58098.1 hypothetical protein G5B37_00505 [Rasiella rasia]
MKYFKLAFCLLCVLVFGCKNDHTADTPELQEETTTTFSSLNSLDWLIGEWVNETEEEFSKESWKRLNDSTLTGFSYTKVAQDTVFAETLKLQQIEQKVNLEVVAFGQNNDAPVNFTLVSGNRGTYTFENLAHDFPQRIIYTQPTPDVIHAWIEGEVDGVLKKIDFHFNRKK